MANVKLKFFKQIVLAIMFTTISYVKYRMLHVMRDADAISRVKTGELHPDVLIADVIRKCNFKKYNQHYLQSWKLLSRLFKSFRNAPLLPPLLCCYEGVITAGGCVITNIVSGGRGGISRL